MELFIPEEIQKISSTLHNAGYECYLVGGAIRNQLLGKEAKDYDLTTNAEPNIVTKLFKKVIPTGIKHGTVTILMGNSSFEITTYRIDGKYSDGRRPDKIEFTPSIEEDLIRRDFTINSIAYNIQNKEILDINNGIEDLKNRVIRAIGDPRKRFDEDALRLVRACRFASQLNFNIDNLTYNAMSSTLEKLPDVSKERISEELMKILKSDNPSIAFHHFFNCKMLILILPEIGQITLKNPELLTKAIKDMDLMKTDKPYIKFSRLLQITPDNLHYSIMKDLKLSNDFIQKTMHIIKFLNTDISLLNTDYSIRKFISLVGMNYIDDLFIAWDGMEIYKKDSLDFIKKRITHEIELKHPFNIKDLNITGNDLIKNLNITPGPQIGKILEILLESVLESPQNNNKQQLLINAKQINSNYL
ncbi:MAG: CCA tRNA nucleotidyltransferase [Spirochaetales bacterium]|nr:CCA tRNA nucleotidyltransferase [Spirochaetales bacterium]